MDARRLRLLEAVGGGLAALGWVACWCRWLLASSPITSYSSSRLPVVDDDELGRRSLCARLDDAVACCCCCVVLVVDCVVVGWLNTLLKVNRLFVNVCCTTGGTLSLIILKRSFMLVVNARDDCGCWAFVVDDVDVEVWLVVVPLWFVNVRWFCCCCCCFCCCWVPLLLLVRVFGMGMALLGLPNALLTLKLTNSCTLFIKFVSVSLKLRLFCRCCCDSDVVLNVCCGCWGWEPVRALELDVDDGVVFAEVELDRLWLLTINSASSRFSLHVCVDMFFALR